MSKASQFEKFITKKKAGTVKEAYRQDKRAAKKEREVAINKHFEEKRKLKAEMLAAREAAKQPAQKPVGGKQLTLGKKADEPKNSKIQNTNPIAIGSKIQNTNPIAAESKPQTSNQKLAAMPLNKYIAHSGICARRDAAILVKEGKVHVNGSVVTEPGFKIATDDVVKVNGKKITPTKNMVYILLNKPKDYLTTTDDPQGRKTVLQLIKTATAERVYPIGRLDRNTSGVLLLTNDGDMAQTLSHPSHEVKKIYEVRLDKPVTKKDFETILNGVTLEDGFVAPDSLGYVDPKDKSIIGIEIHSGKNRIVRRIFEHLQYDVRGLDRVMFAGLTKKNVNRGRWRFLDEKEIRILKHFNKKGKK